MELKTVKKEVQYMDGQSLTPDKIKLQQLQELLPEAFSEGKIDWEKLKATLGEDITFSNERYVLNWAGKSDAFKVLQTPSTRTLAPAKEESINFDETENIFIEGENLEVLKVLQKSYFGKIKMIYIDPPYNTGNDSFIYPDKFSETKDEYLKRVGDKDEEGYMTRDGMFRKNSKENGQYHSNWLNMMYPRMYLAKNLLREDGVIFVSIDDNEVHNLRLLMNEVFGEENFIANIVWQKSKKGDAKLIANIHEYIVVYAKNTTALLEKGIWRVKKPGVDEVLVYYDKLKNDLNFKHNEISEGMKKWYNSLPKESPQRSHAHYKCSDDNGLYFPADFAGPDDGRTSRPRYDILHPITGRPCKKPSTGWRWDAERTRAAMLVSPQLIHFGIDETTIPCRKSYLKDIDSEPYPSVFYKDGRSATLIVESLTGKGTFSFPKDIDALAELIKLCTTNNDIVLDFFAGSGSTAHSLLKLNIEEQLQRRFICVQLPELCDERSEAYKAGYKTIADIAKVRIRRVIKKIEAEKAEVQKKKAGELTFDNLENQENQKNHSSDGFKVLKLSDSNFKQWQQIVGKDSKALEEQMKLFVDPVSKTATIENMVYELLLKSGKDINSKIEHKAVSPGEAEGYYCINSNELVFMLEKATPEIVDLVLKEQPQKVIALDRLFTGNDQLKTNTALQMKDAGIEFKTI